MEINKTHDIHGVITTEDITEGRAVLMTSNPGWRGGVGPVPDLTGRLTDLPGVKLPDTLAEAARATYLITWPVDNREPPIIYWPSYQFALRQTMDQATNAPITGRTIYLTYPGNQESVVIPSGFIAIGLTGVQTEVTMPSGQYVYNVAMRVPGTRLRACDTATDGAVSAGMLAIVASGTTPLYEVSRFNATTFALTVRSI